MKRVLLISRALLFCSLLFVTNSVDAQCNCVGNDIWPTTDVPVVNDGLTKTISTAIFAGDSSRLTGFQDKTYTFASNTLTDNLVLRQTWPCLTSGTTPISYTFSGASGVYSLTTLTNSSCGYQAISRTTYYTCVDCVAAPANDDCGGSISLTPSMSGTCTGTAGTVAGATQSQAACLGSSTADDDVWYSFVATQTNHNVVLSTVTWDMVTEVFSGSCGTLTSIACSDPDITNLSGLTIGDTYYLRVYSKSSWQRGTFNVCIASPPPPPGNDNCSGATALTVNADLACGTTSAGTTVGATQSTETAPSCSASGIDDDVWYTFVATGAQQTVVISAASLQSTIAVYSGSCGALTQLSGACANTTSGTATLNLGGLTNGTTYTIRVFTTSTGVTGTFTMCVGTPPPPPANDNCAGATALTVNANLACGVTTDGTTAFATQSTETAPSCSASGIDDDVWYTFTATGAKHTLVLSAASATMAAAVYSGSCGSLTQLSGACASTTAGTVTINLTGLTNATVYTVRIFTTATSGNGTLTLCLGTPPIIPADDCTNPIDLAGQVSPLSGTTVGATNDFTATCYTNTAPDLLYTIDIPSNNVLHIGQTVNAYDSRNYIGYSGACPGATQIACWDDPDEIKTKWLNNTGSGQLVYFVQDGHLSGSGTFTLAWLNTPQAANDDCAGAVAVTTSASGACSYTTHNTSGGTKSGTPNPTCTSTDNDEDVWFTFTTTSAGAYIVRYNALTATFGTAATMGIDLYTGSCGTLSPVGGVCNNALGSSGSGSSTVTLAASTTYTLRMWITGNTTQTTYGVGTFGLCVEQPAACPSPSASISGTITATSAILNWTENGSATNWDISYGVAPLADPNAGTIINTSTKPYTLNPPLSPETTYDFYVRSYCGGTPSAWSSPKATFTTLFDCATSTVLTCGGSVTSGNLAVAGGIWSFPGTFPANSCGFSTLGKEKVYRFTPTTTGTHAINITSVNGGTGYNDYFFKVGGSCSNTGWTCIRDLNTVSSTSFGPLTAGVEYYLLLDAESAASTANHTFNITCAVDQTYVSSNTSQLIADVPSPVSAGSVNSRVMQVQVVVIGGGPAINVTQLNLNTTGTTTPADIVNAKVFYTGTSATFSTATQFGTTVVTPSGAFSVNGTQAMTGGLANTTNYFWVTYDVACAAAGPLDVQCTSIVIGGNTQTPTTTSPAETIIVNAISSFNTNADGNFSNPSTWACGVPPSGTALPININNNVTFDQNFSLNGNLVIAANRTLSIPTNTLTVNPLATTPTIAVSLIVNGTMTLSGTGVFTIGSSLPGTGTANMTIASGGIVNVNTGGTLNVGTSNLGTTASNLTVSFGGQLFNAGGVTNVGPTGGFRRTLTNTGTFNISGGTVNMNGTIASSGNFSMSSGDLNIDSNDGVVVQAANSFAITSASGTVNGGTITFVDPSFSGTFRVLSYASGSDLTWSGNTVVLGSSTGSNSSTGTVGFSIDTYVSTGRLFLNSVTCAGGSGTNRFASGPSATGNDLGVAGTFTVNSGSEFRQITNGGTSLSGNIVNNGTITIINTLRLARSSGAAATIAQSISGNGIWRNLSAFPTANMTSLTVNNTSGTPIVLPSAMITGTGTGSVSGTLTLTAGVLDLNGGTLTLGTGTGATGSFAVPSNTTTPVSWIAGTFQRWIASASAGIRYFPVGTTTTSRLISINYPTGATIGGRLAATFVSSTPGTAGLPITYNTLTCAAVSPTGYWQMTPITLAGGTYTAIIDATGFRKSDGSTAITDLTGIRLAKRPDAGNWADAATAAAPANLNLITASGMTGFSVFGVIGTQSALPVELTKFSGISRDKSNLLNWESSSELNFDRYVLERGPDAREELFTPITEVLGTGSVTLAASYKFEDTNPLALSYYRLKMMDLDGSYEYSKIIVLENTSAATGNVLVYPNPTQHAINLAFDSENSTDYLITITDLTGKIMSRITYEAYSGKNVKEINIANYPAGFYQVNVSGGNINQNVKIIKE